MTTLLRSYRWRNTSLVFEGERRFRKIEEHVSNVITTTLYLSASLSPCME